MQKQTKVSRTVLVLGALVFGLVGGGLWAAGPTEGGVTMTKQKSYTLGNALVEEGTLADNGKVVLGVTVVTPTKVPIKAGVVWGHWLGDVKSDRSQYLDEAVQLADQGVVSVLPDMFWGDWSWYSRRIIDQDAENAQRQVQHFRAAVNLLATLTAGTKARLGFVGHDYSALFGASAIADDSRIQAAVFIAMPSSQYDWAFFRGQPSSMEKYKKETLVWEPAEVAPRFKVPVFLQFAEQDPYVARSQREALIGFFGSKATTRVYPSTAGVVIGHSMTADVIRLERDQWLLSRLK